MDRLLLIAATLVFAVNFALVVAQLRQGIIRVRRRSLALMTLGFALQSAVLWMRGEMQGRCPITSLFEILVFLSWAIVGWYLVLGPGYRLSLLGMLTAALVTLLQGVALLPGIYQPGPDAPATSVDPWIELHGSLSLLAYGAFGIAALAGLMFLFQDRGLKRQHHQGIFFHLPPITHLFRAMMLVISLGGALLAAGMVAGYFVPAPTSGGKHLVSWIVLALYLVLISLRWIGWSHRKVAIGAVAGFVIAALSLWLIGNVASSQ